MTNSQTNENATDGKKLKYNYIKIDATKYLSIYLSKR